MKKIDSSPALVPANLALYLVRAYYYHNETCYQKLEAEGLYTMIKKFSKLCQNDWIVDLTLSIALSSFFHRVLLHLMN